MIYIVLPPNPPGYATIITKITKIKYVVSRYLLSTIFLGWIIDI